MKLKVFVKNETIKLQWSINYSYNPIAKGFVFDKTIYFFINLTKKLAMNEGICLNKLIGLNN